MTSELPPPEAARWSALLSTLDTDAAPPDAATLAALRARSAQAFTAAIVPSPTLASRTMSTMMFRLSAVLLAVAAAVAVMLQPWSGETLSSATTFDKVLAQLRSATSLELRIIKPNETATVWVRSPGLVRYDDAPRQYRIAAGSRLWQIDEAANTVVKSDSPWFNSAAEQIDLLALLEIDVTDASRLLRARPREQRTYHGQSCDVYAATLPAEQGPVTIEAYTDRATYKLVGIVARAPDAPHHAPPLAELQLVAVNPPVDDAKFTIAQSLTEDGRLGNVTAAQGVIGVRPLLAKRWTPVCRDLLLKPGDWVRADLRGANAVRLTLSSQVEITLGPGALLECISPTQARLHSGVAQVHLPKVADISFELLAPRTGSQKFATPGKQLWRVDRGEQLVAVPSSPLWLQGFEGSTNNESLGSLIVNLPDGRNAPLAVGYHKVTVEIRDQIARTTIEESFVNHTNSRLEGVFHFPLPADASISGFGMWIGDELVEADVVEKQRAREIYETILREKRDPGLLEWTVGNLFKARVFPIEANSEKRVKIVYTQMLPLRAGRYRYAYSLRSELLQTRPLRELSLQVTVNSALPLKSITCPTHTVRTQQTAHSAQVDFTAQEYTPTRDFELACELDAQQADLVAIPHRRGDDGYLLVQLSPPSAAGNWQRELLPDAAPQQIVLVCDTSASMDSEKRRQQREFVAAVLASLCPDDQFNLVAADLNAVWAFPKMVAANAENTAKASTFLDERISLGWTDLDRALQAVLKKSPAKAQVIYIGDGLVTAGDTDPASFVKRFALMLKSDKENARTFHAVTTGNTHDAVVLRGIATQGGGSVRAIAGEQTPPAVALELLNEIAQPGLRDLNIEFRGVRVAAVYPERLPNLPAGTQQMLVARFLPTGKDQHGEVIVTGQRNGEPVRYVAKLAFADAEAGNAFIPRLWARAHLDQLLAQGPSTAVRDQVIALSEQFHIITPYTSLLVLETDADRERFGVQRRYEMRDGERYFAQGAKAAQTDLLQQQMRRAGDWRVGLRRQVLRQLAKLGRNAEAVQLSTDPFDDSQHHPAPGLPTSGSSNFWGITSGSGAFGGGSGLGGGGEHFRTSQLGLELLPRDEMNAMDPFGSIDERDEDGLRLGVGEKREDAELDFDEQLSAGVDVYVEESSVPFAEPGLPGLSWAESGIGTGYIAPFETNLSITVDNRTLHHPFARPSGNWSGETLRSWSEGPDYSQWFDELFPHLEAKPAAPLVDKSPKNWSPEAIALSRSLLRGAALKKMPGGLELRRTSETFDPVWQRRTSRHSSLDLYSPRSWLTRSLDADDHTLIDYCHGEQRGIYSLALLLGCERVAVTADREPSALYLDDNSLDAIHITHSSYSATVEPAGDHRAQLILRIPESTTELRLTIDTQKHVVLAMEHFVDGQRTQLTTFDQFFELAGSWWAKQSLTVDDNNRKLAETRNELTALTPVQFAKRMDEELIARELVQFVHLPTVPLATARQKASDGSATFDDRLTLLMHYAQLQQWDDLLAQLTAAEKLAPNKPGVRWLRTVLLKTIGRREEARQRLLDEARTLVAKPQANEIFLANFLLRQSAPLAAPSEQLEILKLLKPVYLRQPAELAVLPDFEAQLADVYENLQRHEAALALRKQLAEQAPWELSRQIDFAQRLNRAGQHAEALAWLERELARPRERDASEETRLRTAFSDLLIAQSKWPEWLAFTTAWIAKQPTAQTAYQQHLSAMIYNNQLEQAHELALHWLQESCIPGKLTGAQIARLEAAIAFAQGSSYNLSFRRMEYRWETPLATAAFHFLRHQHHFKYLPRIVDYRFRDTQAGDRLRGELFLILRGEVKTLSPAQLQFLVPFTLTGRLEFAEPLADRKQLLSSELPLADWQQIADQLHKRWRNAQTDHERQVLGGALYALLNDRFHDTRLLPFLREQLKSAPEALRASSVTTLFEALLAQPWNNDHEREAFALLKQLSSDTDAHLRLSTELPALYRLVDELLDGRRNQAERVWRDAGETDKLTRSEVQAKRAEFLRNARLGLAASLGDQAAQAKGPLADWLRMEQSWLLVQLEQETPQALASCWKLLGDAPRKQVKEIGRDEQLMPAQAIAAWSTHLLQQRAFVTVQYLAARRNARPATIDKALQYINAGIAHGKEDATVWRKAKFQLLVALDRPDDLERELRSWIREDVATAPWRVMLGYLLAERGDLKGAIPLLEAAEKDKLLTAADYRALADWYLVDDRREAYEQAQITAYKQQSEYVLSNYLEAIRNRWYRTDQPLPSELDERTLLTFRALFEKSANPEKYLSQLQAIHAACRDFRLLQMLPDAVFGRTPNQIYPYLRQVDSVVLSQLRNEATADEIIARIKRRRQSEQTPTDLRALDLLEALVERRSSELLNQPGPHAAACLQALQRAFDRNWSVGEPAQMATFLAELGKLPQPALVAEQLRELAVLQAKAEPHSRDHLQITSKYSEALFSSYDRREEALQMMEAEVRDYLQANHGIWPPKDNAELSQYIAMYEKLNRHAVGERILQAQQAETKLPAQQRWYRERLLDLYQNALEHSGEVSLGKGEALLASTVKLINDDIAQATDENARYVLVTRMCNLLTVAHNRKTAGVNDLVRSFAFESIPRILPRQQQQYRNTAQAPQAVVLAALGPKLALQYVVERMEQYPDRFETGWDAAWRTFGKDLVHLRHAASSATPSFKELDPRVLKLTLQELRHDLRYDDNRNRNIYHHNYNDYWKEQQPEFARVANEVQAELKDSGRHLVDIADYFWYGLQMHARAIEILLLAERDAILDESGRSQLIDYLQKDRRHAEAIPLLETLTRERQEVLDYRLRLMRAYFHAKRPTQLRELLTQTDELFHQEGRWVAESIGELATTCAECELTKEAVAYFQEAIALRQRDNAGATRGDALLSEWYQYLAHLHSQLGQTRLAVDAACAAVVCWTERHHERVEALTTLQQVLQESQDLDGFVRQLDADTAKSGEDSPLLRKALGQEYQAREQLPVAIAQYKLALALQPQDSEIHQALIACFDAANQPREATWQLLALLEIERHNLPLYQQLAERYRDDETEAERAATSIIEADANEAENHAALAELRQKQERWGEAIPHWQRVAELRRLEPHGLLKLAAAQLHEKQWDAARQSIQTLQRTEWPARFVDVAKETQRLAEQLPK